MRKATADIQSIIDYFLHLFTIQVLGPARKPDAAQAVRISDNSTASTVYELKLRIGKTDKYRRMSILPIGERVESKSMCFSVIYDEPLVIKIPPHPITELTTYLAHIKLEHRIARRLSPTISCIFPRMHTILKKLPFVRLPGGLTPEETENACIAELRAKPGVQQYLKINNSFVYFMELSRHGFFNQVIESMHVVKERMRSDILQSMPEAFTDLPTFESLYGNHSAPVYLDLCRLYADFEDRVDRLSGKHGNTGVAPYQRRQWFFSRIAGFRPEIEADDLPEGLPEKLHELTDTLIAENRQSLDNLYKTVHARIQHKNFQTNRLRIKGLTVSVLELLYRLNQQQVAIRDLKPDNMYIDRQLDAAEHILADPTTYGLGLIDLETAVGFNKGEKPPQPLLAGTPPFATPSHVFPNPILRRLYPETLERIFYLQDWYAAVAIIFHIINGRVLFAKTGRLMPEIIRARRNAGKDPDRLLRMYTNVSGKFWKTAIAEFIEKIKRYQTRTESVEISFPHHLKTFLAGSAYEEKHQLEADIRSRINRHSFLDRRRDEILKASPRTLQKSIREKILQGRRPDSQTADALQALYAIAHAKYRIAHLQESIQRISSAADACFILSFMLERVFYTMHPPDWSADPSGRKGPCMRLYPPRTGKI